MEITFITTGGSIDKDYPRAVGGYAFELGEPAVKRILEKIKPNFKYKIKQVLKKDSLDITAEDREVLLKTCRNENADKIIITHGTDTMLVTAKKLSTIKNKVIILTGATRPERFSDSDAYFNIGCALGAATVLKNGIYIVMNGRVYRWDKCKRDEKTGRFVED